MTEETEQAEAPALMDAPNQQAVRPDGSGPWESRDDAEEGGGEDIGSMTKDELLGRAQELGVTPANASMTKAELLAAIEAAED